MLSTAPEVLQSKSFLNCHLQACNHIYRPESHRESSKSWYGTMECPKNNVVLSRTFWPPVVEIFTIQYLRRQTPLCFSLQYYTLYMSNCTIIWENTGQFSSLSTQLPPCEPECQAPTIWGINEWQKVLSRDVLMKWKSLLWMEKYQKQFSLIVSIHCMSFNCLWIREVDSVWHWSPDLEACWFISMNVDKFQFALCCKVSLVPGGLDLPHLWVVNSMYNSDVAMSSTNEPFILSASEENHRHITQVAWKYELKTKARLGDTAPKDKMWLDPYSRSLLKRIWKLTCGGKCNGKGSEDC